MTRGVWGQRPLGAGREGLLPVGALLTACTGSMASDLIPLRDLLVTVADLGGPQQDLGLGSPPPRHFAAVSLAT